MQHRVGRTHACAAVGCPRQVPLKWLMCREHWRVVPKAVADDIWRTYTPGQEEDLSKVTPEYLAAMRAAIEAVK